MPYGPKLLVEKIECRNHIIRNYCQKLPSFIKKTEYPCYLRKHITRHILRFRTAITRAIKYRKNSYEATYKNIEGIIIVNLF